MTSTIKSHDDLSNVGWALCLCPPTKRAQHTTYFYDECLAAQRVGTKKRAHPSFYSPAA